MFIIDYKLVRYNELPSHFAEGRLLNVSWTFLFTTLLLQDLCNVEHRLVKQCVEI